ncbi:MAG: metallophosphoesterase family protein [Halobacteria archaeon]|nr:metallophosphoesterase family protein [Halobacteria archaeon]
MVRVAIISDTHIPSRASDIPGWVRQKVEEADHVIHAGDFDSKEAYQHVQELSDGLTAVYGNMDSRSLGLPKVATKRVEGVEFVVTHGTGSPHGYEDRVINTVRENASDDADRIVGVAGHTHKILDKEVGSYHLLNPGSATGAWPATKVSMQTAVVDGSEIRVTTHEE